jgi:hypothetical protein
MIALPIRKLSDGEVITFEPFTKIYGRAEFQFCVVWKYARLVKIHITPTQQPNALEQFELDVKNLGIAQFAVSSYTHEGIEDPRTWMHSYCKDHKGHCFRLYVPAYSNAFRVSILSTLSIMFLRTQ